MKLLKNSTPRESYVVASRNGVRLAKSGKDGDQGNPEVLDGETDIEALEALGMAVKLPQPVQDPEPG